MCGEFGRAAFDVRHRFTFAGTLNLPWWQVSLNPFIVASSGAPFNIVTGQDTNGDPALYRASFFCARRCGLQPSGSQHRLHTLTATFNLQPAPGEALIPRNFGQSPGFVSVNMRISKTWNFGTIHSSSAANRNGRMARARSEPDSAAMVAAAATWSRALAFRAFRAAAAAVEWRPAAAVVAHEAVAACPASAVRPVGGGAEAKRYSMQFSLNFQNLFNHVNLSPPNGNLVVAVLWSRAFRSTVALAVSVAAEAVVDSEAAAAPAIARSPPSAFQLSRKQTCSLRQADSTRRKPGVCATRIRS